MTSRIVRADSYVALALMADASVDAIVCDPPYMLGFMGKAFDNPHDNPADDPEFWRLALRVLKPGGHLLAFGGTRTYHRMASAVEAAGFEVRDMLHWTYGSGFPKSHNVARALNGNGADWNGWGTALKPSHEPIVVARKPLSGTVAANVLEWGTGAVNVDGCRVPTGDSLNGGTYSPGGNPSSLPGDARTATGAGMFAQGGGRIPGAYKQPAGRWPPNTLLSHAPGCGDDCAPGCPVAEMGRQSGERQSRAGAVKKSGATVNCYGEYSPPPDSVGYGSDTGTAARFYPNFDADPGFLYVAKASRAERNAGTERNAHPTVKPIAVMRWLVRLVTPPGGMVLDPFAGSGSTVIAAHLEGFNAIGIEREAEYAEIARARVRWWVEDADEKARAKTVPNSVTANATPPVEQEPLPGLTR